MTTETDPYADLPESWSQSARDLYVNVDAENPAMSSAAEGALWEACTLISSADAMSAEVDRVGLMTTGYKGQPVANPLIAEARQARAAAIAALKSFGVGLNQSGASRAGAALASKRWSRR
ncbi:hypothetical protein E7744_02765 [Citricoccus sp. SGAir0253]|uniref:P27 family phage terminase small subunit n=1 Tax=Citricoccus sp. SGAir0253 TaxID=2567881 RepID=UPI0010CCC803|nr:P27 family phage terminase small subunit [Citricoccus sp. SGAir0253]QCU77258.1 hypothetical protein E7744_02765 [Citricoccus sp. SGAir0253]